MLLNCITVGLGGFVGSVFRYLIGLIPLLNKGCIPYQTLLVNVFGAIFIGMIVKSADSGQALSSQTVLFLKVGLCGGFTTFSTFSLESLAMLESGRFAAFALYIFASIVLCIAGVFCGKWLMGAMQ